MNKISFIIPAYNEETRVGDTVMSIISYAETNHYEIEVIVVNDGSADRTGEIVKDISEKRPNVFLLNNEKKEGKGYSVREGVRASRGGIIIFTDADGSVPITELPKFICAIEKGAKVAIASRAISGADIIKRQPLWRQSMGKIFNFFVQRLILKGIPDTQCGFKCFTRETALKLFDEQKINGFAFDAEILYLAKLYGYPVVQIPVKWINSPKSSVRPLSDSIVMFKDLFIIKKLHKKQGQNTEYIKQ